MKTSVRSVQRNPPDSGLLANLNELQDTARLTPPE